MFHFWLMVISRRSSLYCLTCHTADSPACTIPVNMAGHRLAPLGWISTLRDMRSCGWWLVGIVGGICVWCWREVVSRLVPQLIKNEWKEKGEELLLLHCCLLLELFNSHLSGGCSAAPTGHAVYTILNPTAARRCSQVLCNTAPQLLDFSSHTTETCT